MIAKIRMLIRGRQRRSSFVVKFVLKAGKFCFSQENGMDNCESSPYFNLGTRASGLARVGGVVSKCSWHFQLPQLTGEEIVKVLSGSAARYGVANIHLSINLAKDLPPVHESLKGGPPLAQRVQIVAGESTATARGTENEGPHTSRKFC